MSWLQNSWMDNSTFLAEMAHFAWAYGILLTAALFCLDAKAIGQLFLAFVAFAVIKEFWYDLRYEIPPDSVAGSTLDFAVYLFGGLFALAIISIQRMIFRPRLSTLDTVSKVDSEGVKSSQPRLYVPEED